jgi:uncharacterized protein YrrD
MFKKLRDLERFRLAAEDGEIGHVADLYFDDDCWAVRYLVVATGSWLFGKKVLISPNAVDVIKWDSQCIKMNLSMEQIKNSPDIDTDRPISRQQEAEYHLYYNFPPYWGGVALWGRYSEPGASADKADTEQTQADQAHGGRWDSHLRSAKEVRGYRVMAIDGQVGHVDNFLMDPDNWAIRYLIVNTGGWLKKHEVLVTPKLTDRVIWAEAQVNINASRELIEGAPHYTEGEEIDRDYEERLFAHYTTHPYWEEGEQRPSD